MGRNTIENTCYQTVASSLNLNNLSADKVIEQVIQRGVQEFCISPGARNAALVYVLEALEYPFRVYYWPEERSSAFFALGRIKSTKRPVAVITTSGTAAAELLPATMEAYYLGLPLLLMTADRPRRYRGSGAPQCAEQVNLYGTYVHYQQDLEANDTSDLHSWSCQGPAHLNLCFEEPLDKECKSISLQALRPVSFQINRPKADLALFNHFIQNKKHPLVIVGELPVSSRDSIIQFLLHLKAPIYAEALSGLRENAQLDHLRIKNLDYVWQTTEKLGCTLDGILRLGGVPTTRLWRDLEDQDKNIVVCSVSEVPFSGLSEGEVIHTSLKDFAVQAKCFVYPAFESQAWLHHDHSFHLETLFQSEPQAEPSLIHFLSQQIPSDSLIYLGNSLPIREWDLAAAREDKNWQIEANRGLNGIDGQLSTFLGLCEPERDNWAIIGDLTALYDLAAPWILSQLQDVVVTIVVINNGGGQIFSGKFSSPLFLNEHRLNFEPLARFWGLDYERWTSIPDEVGSAVRSRLIEIIPDNEATQRFAKSKAH